MTRTRFAPSPTGSLHIGGVRTALYCLLWARKTGGRFLLRIEDTDQARSTEEAANGILRDMKWVGLDWDEGPEVGGPVGPYFQSQRLATYDRYIGDLMAAGKAYHAYETGDELTAERKAAEAKKETFLYRRREYSKDDLARFEAEGRKPVVRLLAPRDAITVADRVLGDVTVPGEQLDDLVLRKADGFPTYHFAVVVDDQLMGVELVLRGQEHLMNTHKHEGICRAFGWTRPECAHLPLINNPTGTKMSKRDKAKIAREAAKAAVKAGTAPADLADRAGVSLTEMTAFLDKKSDSVPTAEALARVLGLQLPMIEVADFRRGGYLPEALLNYLLLLGWNPGNDREFYTLDEMVDAFDIERINKTAAKFDPAKLEWMNGEYMKRLPVERLLDLHDQYLAVWPASPMQGLSRASREPIFALWRERAATFSKMDEMAGFLFRRPASYDERAVKKHLADGGLDRLAQAHAAFDATDDWTAAGLEAAVAPLTDGTPQGMGRFAQPLRVAITGTAVSPPIYDVLAYLGRDEVLARIADAREKLA